MDDLLDEGEALLRRGAWRAAYERFTEALATASGDPAEARAAEARAAEARAAEGAARASWWLDDDKELIGRYEQAYRGYRAAGDPRGAARVAAWLGNAALQLRGETAIARGWFQRAGRLLEDVPESLEHGLLALFKGMAAHGRGDLEPALEQAGTALRIGHDRGSVDLEIQAMALRGAVRIGLGAVDDGMRLLDEAAAAAFAGETGEVGTVWMPSCYLVQGCEQVRDWDRAEQWCLRVMDFCRRFDLGSPFSRCRTHYGTLLLSRGDWSAAESQLARAAESLLPVRPVFAADAMARLGELRRRQGRRAEAADLFKRAGPAAAARVGRAEIAIDEGDPAAAIEIAERLLGELPGMLDRIPALEVLVRAGVAAGVPAGFAVEELEEIAGRLGIDAVTACAVWARGVHDDDVGRLRRAVDLFEVAQDAYGAARARLDLAHALSARGRAADAAEETETAREALRALGTTAAGGTSGELTSRQIEVLRLLAVGLTNAEVAERLVLSEHTVKRHVANILAKLALPSRAAAVAYATRAGLL